MLLDSGINYFIFFVALYYRLTEKKKKKKKSYNIVSVNLSLKKKKKKKKRKKEKKSNNQMKTCVKIPCMSPIIANLLFNL